MSQQKVTRLVAHWQLGHQPYLPSCMAPSVQWGHQLSPASQCSGILKHPHPHPLPIYSRTHTHACIHTHMHILCPGSALEVLEMGSSQGEQRHNYKGSCLHQAGSGFGDRTSGNGKGTKECGSHARGRGPHTLKFTCGHCLGSQSWR